MIEQTGQKLAYVASGVHQEAGEGKLAATSGRAVRGLNEVIASTARHSAVENVFVNVNPQSTLLLGQARGAAICAAVSGELPVAEYTALQIKQAVVGHGKAAKEQVQEMVQRLLALPGRARPPTRPTRWPARSLTRMAAAWARIDRGLSGFGKVGDWYEHALTAESSFRARRFTIAFARYVAGRRIPAFL